MAGKYKEETYDRLHEFLGAHGDVEPRVHELKAERDSLAERVKELEEKHHELRRDRDNWYKLNGKAAVACDTWMNLYLSLKNPLAKILGTEHIETIVEKVKAIVAESPTVDARNWARLYGELIADYGLEPDLSKEQYEEVSTFISDKVGELGEQVDQLQAENETLREQLASPDERASAQTVYNFMQVINLN
jgi:uncharacterized coiled-coil DUF342 family protein